MADTNETERHEPDPYWEVARDLADKYESGLPEDDTPLFLKFMRGEIRPDLLTDETRQYFERVNAHVHIEGLLENLGPKLHDVAVDRRRHDNRTALMAEHVRNAVAPHIEAALEEARKWPHGYHYETHEDARELSITEGFYLGVALALVDLRQQTIEEQYGGPSHPRTM